MKNNFKKAFVSAILAGAMVGMAGTVYLNLDLQWFGSILFMSGLILVCLRGYNLYTGAIGYFHSIREVPKFIIYIIGNIIGVALVALIPNPVAAELAFAKLQMPLGIALYKSIFCGVLMYLAVDIYRSRKSILGIMACIPMFILAGFEHSIADAFYFISARMFSLDVLVFMIVVLLGNAIGSIIYARVERWTRTIN